MALTRHDSARVGAGVGGDYGRLRNRPDGHRSNWKAGWENSGAVFNLFGGVFARPGEVYPHFYVPGGCTGARGRRSRWENSSHLRPLEEGRESEGFKNTLPRLRKPTFRGLKTQIPTDNPTDPKSNAAWLRSRALSGEEEVFSYSLSQA